MGKAFAGAMKEYFGLNGKTVAEFAKELRALSYEERQQFHEMLIGQGIECDPPMKPVAV